MQSFTNIDLLNLDGTDYVLYVIWQQRLYLCGLLVRDAVHQRFKWSSNMYISVGHPWIHFHFYSIFVADPTCILRIIPSPTHSPGHIRFRGTLVSPEKPVATACASWHLDPVGS